jgi:hypothetical protein
MLTRVKTDRAGMVANAICCCGGRLAARRRVPGYVCLRCRTVVPANRVWLAINTRVVH